MEREDSTTNQPKGGSARWPLGQHQGTEVAKLPLDFIEWAADEIWAPDIRLIAINELARRRGVIDESA